MTKLFIGIDVSKDKLDATAKSPEAINEGEHLEIMNDAKEITKLIRYFAKKAGGKNHLWVCCEHTGAYSMLLRLQLDKLGIKHTVLNALSIKRSLGITRGSDDRIDSGRIAEYACRFEDKLKHTKLPDRSIVLTKSLLAERAGLIKEKTRCINAEKAHKQYPKELQVKSQLNRYRRRIEQLEKYINDCEAEIFELITRDEKLDKSNRLLQSVPGIGPIISAMMIVTTENFTAFENARQYNCYIGLAPFGKVSGTIQKPARVSRLSNKEVKITVLLGAKSVAHSKNDLGNYHKRRVAEGKPSHKIRTAMGAKLIARGFAVVRRGTPFTTLYQHTFQHTYQQHLEVSKP